MRILLCLLLLAVCGCGAFENKAGSVESQVENAMNEDDNPEFNEANAPFRRPLLLKGGQESQGLLVTDDYEGDSGNTYTIRLYLNEKSQVGLLIKQLKILKFDTYQTFDVSFPIRWQKIDDGSYLIMIEFDGNDEKLKLVRQTPATNYSLSSDNAKILEKSHVDLSYKREIKM